MSGRTWYPRGDERGSITPFVLIALLALLPLGGLVIDGGRQLNGRARAIAYAQEAARAGAQALDLQVDETRLVIAQAEQLVQVYCDEAMNGNGEIAGDPSLVRCEPVQVRDSDIAGDFVTIGVRTTVEFEPLLLGMVRPGMLQANGRAVARAFTGITEADEGLVPTVPPPLEDSATPDDSGGLPTIGPGEQTPEAPGTVPTCIPRDPDDPGGGSDPAPPPSSPTPTPPAPTDPSATPTTPPTTVPTEPPGNNDLDDDNGPSCPRPGDDEGGNGGNGDGGGNGNGGGNGGNGDGGGNGNGGGNGGGGNDGGGNDGGGNDGGGGG